MSALAGKAFETALVKVPDHGFFGWKEGMLAFAPTNSSRGSIVLADWNANRKTSPFALFDGLSAVSSSSILEPSTRAMMALGFALLSPAGFQSSRRKSVEIG